MSCFCPALDKAGSVAGRNPDPCPGSEADDRLSMGHHNETLNTYCFTSDLPANFNNLFASVLLRQFPFSKEFYRRSF